MASNTSHYLHPTLVTDLQKKIMKKRVLLSSLGSKSTATVLFSPHMGHKIKLISQMTEEELEQLEYDDEGLFQQLGEMNRPPDYIVKALQNNVTKQFSLLFILY